MFVYLFIYHYYYHYYCYYYVDHYHYYYYYHHIYYYILFYNILYIMYVNILLDIIYLRRLSSSGVYLCICIWHVAYHTFVCLDIHDIYIYMYMYIYMCVIHYMFFAYYHHLIDTLKLVCEECLQESFSCKRAESGIYTACIGS